QTREKLSERDRDDPRQGHDRDDARIAPARHDRDRASPRSVDEEESDDAEHEQALRPVLQGLDQRDRDESGKHVDDRLAQCERREGEAGEGHEERDIEREEHREAADEEAGACPRIDAAHVWHDTTRCQYFPLNGPGVRSAPEMLPPMAAEDLYAFRFLTDAQISPDGTRVAYAVREIDREKNTYRSAIWLVPFEGG